MAISSQHQPKAPFLILTAAISLFGGFALSLLYRFGDGAFGYDTGLYRRYILDYYAHAPNTIHSPFGFHYLSDALLTIGFSLDAIAYGLYLATALGIIVLVFVYASTLRDRWTGAIAAILTATSLTWLDFFGWYYYRNLLALFGTLTVLILYQKRSPFIILPLIFIGIIHPISLVPIGLTLIIRMIQSRDERKYLLMTGGLSLVLILVIQYRELIRYLPFLTQSSGLASRLTNSAPELTGQFIDLRTYLLYAYPYLFFGLLALPRFAKKYAELSLLFAVTSILMLIQVILYRRLFMTLDLTLIILAALFLHDWFEKFPHPRSRIALSMLYSVIILLPSVFFIARAVPLVTQNEILAMTTLRLPDNRSLLLAMTPITAPWLYGFTPYSIVAPGMLEANVWDAPTWFEFWTTQDTDHRRALLESYTTSSIFIFIGQNDAYVSQSIFQDPHLVRHNEFLWEYRIDND